MTSPNQNIGGDSGIQRAAQTVLGVYLKRTCSRVPSAPSALAVLNDYADIQIQIHSLTHLNSPTASEQNNIHRAVAMLRLLPPRYMTDDTTTCTTRSHRRTKDVVTRHARWVPETDQKKP